ncbi:MAG TPA: inositol monophosphatase family protein [Propylenella sp.]|jgi:myo-inositol-1(or 4)-monophosphatase
MTEAPSADLELLKRTALAAGQLAMTFFRRNPSAWAKAGGSPVTEADMAVDAFLRTSLLAERPDYGWLSEESADNPARRGREAIFIADPIDGTRGFIEGDDRWCVSVAVVRGGRPTAAALYAPARDELFTAVLGGGAWLRHRRLSVAAPATLAGARIAGPRGWLRTRAIADLGASLAEHVPSLAYRFAAVAAGRLDAAFVSPRAHDWDLAACDLLVHEAGGRLTGLDGAAPCYNREFLRHGVLAATSAELQPAFLAVVAEAGREVARGLPPRRSGIAEMTETSGPRKDQLLHLVFGGELESLEKVRFRDLGKLDIVGIYPNYAQAYTAWKEKAQMTVDNAQIRYFIVHLHRLLQPEDGHGQP